MKRIMQGIFVLTAVIMVLSLVLTGCGSSKNETESNNGGTASNSPTPKEDPNKIDLSKEVQISLHTFGAKPAAYDEVFGEVNKLAKKDLNANVEVNYIAWGDYAQKYPLMFASGEKLDIVYAANWANYVQEANKGGFMEITEEMIEKYMPQTYANLPKEGWEQSKVDGKIYMIPNHDYKVYKRVAIIRGDLREKYNLPKIKTHEDYIKYLETIAENEKELLAYNASAAQVDELVIINYLSANEYEYVAGIQFGLGVFYDITEPSGDIFLKTDDPKYLEYLKLVKRLNDKGVWSKNVLANSTNSVDSFTNGRSATHLHHLYSISNVYNNILEKNPEFKPEVYDVNAGKKTITSALISGGAVIAATSKNVERSLMFLDKVRYDRDYYDLFWYGIKGKHWEPVGDDKFKPLPEGAEKFPVGNAAICCTTPLNRIADNTPEFKTNMSNHWMENDIVNPDLAGFNFNDENVKAEIAALSNVYSTYLKPLEYGNIADVEKGLAIVKEKYKQAGIDKVVAEVRAQIAEFRKK